MAALFGLRFI